MPEEFKIEYKTFEIVEIKATTEDGKFYLSGYANNKGKADSYEDIPTNYKNKKVYDITRMKKNPVMLVDHMNSARAVMGNFVELEEDDKGLRFKALLRNPEKIAQDWLKDVLNGYMDGFIRSLSIGGRWLFEDVDNPRHLTRAIIHEISGVAVGADGLALTTTQKPKFLDTGNEQQTKQDENPETVESLLKIYRKTKDEKILDKILEVKKNGFKSIN